jgi:phosphoglycolate phosphatase
VNILMRHESVQPERYLVFDLDGTISDPALGVSRCLNYSLTIHGFPGLSGREVSRFIGPPLDDAFREITGSGSEKLITDLVATFRERYGRVGYTENSLYPGIPEAIRHIASRQIPLGICTTKRTDCAEKVMQLFRLRPYFSFISGGDIGIKKEDQLRVLLENNSIGKNAVMIGDRAVDISAARANGIGSAGVLWGHGSRRELEEAGPDTLLERPEQLKGLAGA